MAPRKSKLNAVSIGVAFSAVTRAKLNLVAAGLDRPVGWIGSRRGWSLLGGIRRAERIPQEISESCRGPQRRDQRCRRGYG